MSSIKEKILYGFNREPKVRNSLYGILIATLHLLLVGVPLYFGYMMKIIKQRTRGENIEEPPAYKPIVPLLKDGVAVVLLGLSTVGLPLIGTTVINQLLSQSGAELTATDVGILSSVVGVLLILGLIGSYIFPAFLCAYSVTNEWRDAYSLKLVRNVCISKDYAVFYLQFMALSVIAGLVARILIDTIILYPVGAAVMFLYMTTLGAIIGDFARNEREIVESSVSN